MGDDRKTGGLNPPPVSHDRITNRADYDRIRRTFRWECPEYFNFGFDVVDYWAQTHPDHVAIHWVGEQHEVRLVTFAEFAQRSGRLAQAFSELGLKRGDRVLVALPRVVAWWESLIGLLKAGLVVIPGTMQLTSRDLMSRLKRSGASAIVADAEMAEKIDCISEVLPGLKRRIFVGDGDRPGWVNYEELLESHPRPIDRVQTRSDDPAMIYFTSGTTGMPKMVLHSQASYGLGHQVTGRFWLDLQPGDLHWNTSDTGWAKAAWSSVFGPWICGASLFVLHPPRKFQLSEIVSYVSKYPITSLCAAPTIFRWLVQLDLSGFEPIALRQCVAAGEPLNPEVITTWKNSTGMTIRDGYGQTETVLLCGNFPGVDVKPGSMGLPAPGFELAIIDEAGSPLPPGKEGDIAVRIEPDRPLGLFQEYWQDPPANAEAFRQGWYRTGDAGRVDEDGYFWFIGRVDDVITSSAYRIGPFEVESALLEHPAVAEAAVIGKPDKLRVEIVMAFIVLAKGYVPSHALKTELQNHVKTVTAPYKYPREIAFVDELPKTVSGKIRRVELRARAASE